MKLCPSGLWDDLARADETATFFQTRAWHELAAQYEGTQAVCLLFEWNGWTAALPIQKRTRSWGALYTAPFGTYATLLCAQEPPPEFYDFVRRSLAHHHLNLSGSPFARRFPTGIEKPVEQTRILPLEGFEPEPWVASWSRNHRRLLRQAQEHGYSVRRAEATEDISRYYHVYMNLVQRWGADARRVYPETLFQDMFRRWGNTPSLSLLLAEKEGTIVAGRMCLHHNRHTVEWHAAAQRNDMERGANHLLVHAAVTAAAAQGSAIYDFNPNPGLPAVDHFKRGFGAQVIEFSGWRQRPGVAGLVAKLRDRLRKS